MRGVHGRSVTPRWPARDGTGRGGSVTIGAAASGGVVVRARQSAAMSVWDAVGAIGATVSGLGVLGLVLQLRQSDRAMDQSELTAYGEARGRMDAAAPRRRGARRHAGLAAAGRVAGRAASVAGQPGVALPVGPGAAAAEDDRHRDQPQPGLGARRVRRRPVGGRGAGGPGRSRTSHSTLTSGTRIIHDRPGSTTCHSCARGKASRASAVRHRGLESATY